MTIAILAIVGVFIAVAIGTVWYMPNTPMGKVHMQYLGFDKLTPEEQKQKMEEGKGMMPRIYGMQMVFSLLTSVAVVFIVTMSMRNGIPFAMALGFVIANWLAFMVPVVGANLLWGTCDPKLFWKKFVADAGANLVTVLLIALLAGFFA